MNRLDDGSYEVAFNQLRPTAWQQTLGWAFKRLRGDTVRVDPLRLSWALGQVMKRERMQSFKHTLVPNHFRVFLSVQDFDRINQVIGHFNAGIGPALDHIQDSLKSNRDGPWHVRLLTNEREDLAPLEARIFAEFTPSDQLPTDQLGELTIRPGGPATQAKPSAATIRPNHTQPAPTTADANATIRTGPSMFTQPAEPVAKPSGAVLVRWDGGRAVLAEGQRLRFGRPDPELEAMASLPNFVALKGASLKISSPHFWVEADGGVLIGREPGANAVKIGDTTLANDQQIAVTLPCDIVLSDGAMRIRLEYT